LASDDAAFTALLADVGSREEFVQTILDGGSSIVAANTNSLER